MEVTGVECVEEKARNGLIMCSILQLRLNQMRDKEC